MRKGNLWGLPVNLILFSLVAGVTTVAAFKVYGEVLLHPEQISAKFDSCLPGLLAALTFAVATLGINVVANFVSPAFDFSNVFPQQDQLQARRLIAAVIALVLYPFAPWEGDAPHFVNAIGADHGPAARRHPRRLLPDRQGQVDVPQLYRRTARTATRAAGTSTRSSRPRSARLFSSVLPNVGTVLPAWWGTYGWFFGVAIGGLVYFGMERLRPRRPLPATAPEPQPAPARS